MADLVAIGECMVELARESDGRFALRYGGDTFNTAVYAARSGVKAGYVTALGDDPYSDGIIALAESEGVATDLIRRAPGRMPGLYLIETDAKGERSFHYWRETAPARELFERDDWGQTVEGLLKARLIHLSGITLSLYSNEGLGRVFAALELARKRGIVTSFDSNFRPRGWKGDLERARRVFLEAFQRADIALPSFDDEQMLWGDSSAEATIERIKTLGPQEIVVKDGAERALVLSEGLVAEVPVPKKVTPVDTTAAGDSFAGAYLAARLKGATAEEATLAGHTMAAHVVQHRGAIVPRQEARRLS